MADIRSNAITKVDVSVTPFLEFLAGADMPKTSSSLASGAFPTGYFAGGSMQTTIESITDGTQPDITITQSEVIALSSTDGSTLTSLACSAVAARGTMIIRYTGYEEVAKTTEVDDGSIVRIGVASAATIADTGTIVDLSTKNDVFVIPYSALNLSSYFVVNENTVVSKPAVIEVITWSV